ncbi:methionine ABC transporter ATP-binding protein [Rummeliibacillus suwonensis]|uniref:methionine ABC transporter ATP-binding protein n=1 Tax=Rummeliibacillus suwonensis TaxID=1306154 RepID=UPI0011B8597E|nr:methionine ABC transporter ATP-binding protein [Rummeliibacillus suwonensis]MBO2537332.1 ATP-binding cassette domain-containing protein [Rummeliibacillus suwonensis]
MIELKNIQKSFDTKDGKFQALKDVSIKIQEGEIFGIIGFSGAGKSTLLRVMNLLERPDSGEVNINGKNLCFLSRKDLLKERQSIGMIFQNFNLLSNKTIAENVEFPLKLAREKKSERIKRVAECLEIVGLTNKKDAYPVSLSGGQRQRVGIARALASNPKILLCDEPTSALDPRTTENILEFLKKINKQFGITIVVVTHEMEVVEQICNKVAVMENGEIVENFDLKEPITEFHSEIGEYLFKHLLNLEAKVDYVI